MLPVALTFLPQIRLARAFLAHFPFNRFAPRDAPSIFRPVIISSRAQMLECDYNLHKSNSSYFTDLDIARGHLLTCLLGDGINRVRLDKGKHSAGPNGFLGIHLGGVTCHFRRQIRPYEAFEVWTRVLSWDEKWLYLVSHLVKAGTAKPRSYLLQPWRKGAARSNNEPGRKNDVPHSAVFASSIARYVVKTGKHTIAPEAVLKAANLLPAEPEHRKESASTALPSAASATLRSGQTDTVDTTPGAPSEPVPWDWEKVEIERKRGLQIVQLMAGLDELHHEFTGDMEDALGQY